MASRRRKNARSRTLSKGDFAFRAFDMITRCDEDGGTVASWSTNGLQFTIHDSEQLRSTYFYDYQFTYDGEPIQFTSFYRQLNNYGFSGRRSGGTVTFSHPSFVKNNRAACKHIGAQRTGGVALTKNATSATASAGAVEKNGSSGVANTGIAAVSAGATSVAAASINNNDSNIAATPPPSSERTILMIPTGQYEDLLSRISILEERMQSLRTPPSEDRGDTMSPDSASNLGEVIAPNYRSDDNDNIAEGIVSMFPGQMQSPSSVGTLSASSILEPQGQPMENALTGQPKADQSTEEAVAGLAALQTAAAKPELEKLREFMAAHQPARKAQPPQQEPVTAAQLFAMQSHSSEETPLIGCTLHSKEPIEPETEKTRRETPADPAETEANQGPLELAERQPVHMHAAVGSKSNEHPIADQEISAEHVSVVGPVSSTATATFDHPGGRMASSMNTPFKKSPRGISALATKDATNESTPAFGSEPTVENHTMLTTGWKKRDIKRDSKCVSARPRTGIAKTATAATTVGFNPLRDSFLESVLWDDAVDEGTAEQDIHSVDFLRALHMITDDDDKSRSESTKKFNTGAAKNDEINRNS